MLVMSKPLEQSTRNILSLLEQMAADASLEKVSTLQASIEKTDISEQEKTLIRSKNSLELAKTLQLDKLITSVIIRSPDEDDDEQEDQKPEESLRALG
jgi:hypothetical protein